MGSSGNGNKANYLQQIENNKKHIEHLQWRMERNRNSLSATGNMSKSTREILKRDIARDRAEIAEYRKRIAKIREQIKSLKK